MDSTPRVEGSGVLHVDNALSIDHLKPISPLLKWPGGKRVLLKHIAPLVPQSYNRYFEPFLGGGAVFFALCPSWSVLSDANQDLMNCYLQVRDKPLQVIDKLSKMENSKVDYYSIRDSEPTCLIQRAARFIYLSTLSFNGIHRVNLNGKFNVPYGYKHHLRPGDAEHIITVSTALSRAEIVSGDFSIPLALASAGDFVYLDPPYTTAHRENGFVKYNASIFSWEDQVRLAELARELHRSGCYVVVSNADHPSIRSLYDKFDVLTIERPSVVAAAGQYRRPVTECIFFNRSARDAQ